MPPSESLGFVFVIKDPYVSNEQLMSCQLHTQIRGAGTESTLSCCKVQTFTPKHLGTTPSTATDSAIFYFMFVIYGIALEKSKYAD